MISQAGVSNDMLKRLSHEASGSASSSETDAASQFKEIFDSIFSASGASMFPLATPIGPKRIEAVEAKEEAPILSQEIEAAPVEIAPEAEAPVMEAPVEQAAVTEMAASAIVPTQKKAEEVAPVAANTTTEKPVVEAETQTQQAVPQHAKAQLQNSLTDQQKENVQQQVEGSPVAEAVVSDHAKKVENKQTTSMQVNNQKNTVQQETAAEQLATSAMSADADSGADHTGPQLSQSSAQKVERASAASVANALENVVAETDAVETRSYAPSVAPKTTTADVASAVAVKAAAERAGAASVSASAADALKAGAVLQDQSAIRIERPQAANPGANLLNAQEKRILMKESASAGKAATPNQARAMEQIQNALDTATRSKDGNTIVVKLDPVEFGEATVKGTTRGDQIFARVSAENPEVESLVRGQVQEIVQALQSAGFKPENVHVSFGAEKAQPEWTLARQWNSQSNAQGDGQESAKGGKQGEAATNGGSVQTGTMQKSRTVEAGWVA